MLIFHFSLCLPWRGVKRGCKGDIFEIKLSVWKFMSAEINSTDIPSAIEFVARGDVLQIPRDFPMTKG